MRRPAWIAAAMLIWALASPAARAAAQEGQAAAAGPRDYAYFTLQGRLTDPSLRKALQGATVRLTAGDEKFETVTDQKGLFVFERLPVASYNVHVISAEGRVVRGIRRIDDGDRFHQRLKMKLGRGEATSFQVHAAEDTITLDVPKPEVRWDRFWKELGIFVGGAALLAF